MGGVADAVSSVVGGVTSSIGGLAGGLISGATGGKSGAGSVPIADQAALNNQIQQQNALGTQAQNNAQQFIGAANNTVGNISSEQQLAQQSIGQGQGAVDLAQNVALGGNEANALQLLQQQANGTAPSAAQAQLTAANNQGIAQQFALANSGNQSQMLGGQKSAMENAAQLSQQNANAATQLRATQQQTGQQNYASAAAAQAGQVAQNAGLQQQQTAQQQGQTAQQLNLYGQQLNAGTNLSNQAISSQQAATNAQLGGVQTVQNAYGQTSAQQSKAAGGAMNALGGAASAGLGMLTGGGDEGDSEDTNPVGAGGVAPSGAGGPSQGALALMAGGGKVQGYSKGGDVDSTKNDTVKTMLSPGEVVIPKSALVSKEKAISFLMKVMEGQGPEPEKISTEELMKANKKKKES